MYPVGECNFIYPNEFFCFIAFHLLLMLLLMDRSGTGPSLLSHLDSKSKAGREKNKREEEGGRGRGKNPGPRPPSVSVMVKGESRWDQWAWAGPSRWRSRSNSRAALSLWVAILGKQLCASSRQTGYCGRWNPEDSELCQHRHRWSQGEQPHRTKGKFRAPRKLHSEQPTGPPMPHGSNPSVKIDPCYLASDWF